MMMIAFGLYVCCDPYPVNIAFVMLTTRISDMVLRLVKETYEL